MILHLLFVPLVVDDAHVLGQLHNKLDGLLLHEVEGHGEEGEAEEDIDAGEDELGLTVLGVGAQDGVAGHKVAEADGGEGDEGKVDALEERPALPGREKDGAEHDVPGDEDKDGEDGHTLLGLADLWQGLAGLLDPHHGVFVLVGSGKVQPVTVCDT